jgi:hypothetical protein
LVAENYDARAILDLLRPLRAGERGWTIGDELSSSAGVREDLTIEGHTLMVARQLERYLAGAPLPHGASRALLRLTVLLHDIGKARANRDGYSQHTATKAVIAQIGESLPLTRQERLLMLALLNGDPIGLFLREKISLEQATNHIRQSARQAQMPPAEFLRVLTLLYQADAASYTADAGSTPSLEGVFAPASLDGRLPYDPALGRLRFSSENEARYQELQTGLAH